MSGSRPSSRTKTKIDHVVPLTPALRFEPQAWHPYRRAKWCRRISTASVP
jgi:hypothetical protein